MWLLVSVLWIAGAAWVETRPSPPHPSGLFDDFFAESRAECEAAATKLKLPDADLAACVLRCTFRMLKRWGGFLGHLPCSSSPERQSDGQCEAFGSRRNLHASFGRFRWAGRGHG